uniref:Putative serine/threonine/dual specificity protein kinase, catalytic domain-containing protein n=2 Tax=Helianthus annuus TaxID=4232 RepID=A0A251TFB8_HELAN
MGDGYASYRAELEHYDKENPSSKRHNTVLIKRYPPSGKKRYGEKEFLTEIEILSSGVKHYNIVNLLGFCFEESEMILVIDNFSNGFLGEYLGNRKDKRVLTWENRLKICIDVAHALRYIHYEMEDQTRIIHRDICSYNIGLDENLEAKIVNFWRSVFLPPNQEDEALYLEYIGKRTYADPEYKKTGKLKRESDVYGFGVVLFEILCGRLANDPIYLKESDKGLAHVARRSLSTGSLQELIDPVIKEEVGENGFVLNRGPNKDSLHTFISIAHQCVAETQVQRPTMKIVVKELEKALFFQNNNKDNPKMSLEDIKRATQNFHDDNFIGGGGFGKVYKGNLQDGDGIKTIVAKRLDTRFGQGEQQFFSELQILLEYNHENVIRLVGYCDETDEKVLIYEYLSKGSLDRYLNDTSLTWVKRLNICIDVARALDFLHGGVGKQVKVIHRDIKTENILLKNDWKAKLADFGLSLICSINQETDYIIDHACGTRGYVDPLYRQSGFLTIESDIYSFGVVLFEILCGRSTFAIHKHEGHYLPDFIKNKFEEGKHAEVVFEQIKEQIVPQSLATFQEIAYQCLHLDREKRPTTKKVLMQLKKALVFQNMASTMNQFAHLQIPLEDVAKATNNFHHDNIIEHGGVGIAYKGRLLWSGRLMEITARRFDCKHGDGDLEFLAEISALSVLKHKNLVSIIGFCDEIDEKIIVTTYEANGSLGQYLNSLNLTWKQRLRICLGVARALSYLHYDKGRDYAILHCNINSNTILLDDNWETKLSGFEFSIKQSVNDKDQVCPCEHTGTLGCVDPAIEKTGGVTHKSDIYSFGVVLFEILCERKALIHNEVDKSLALLAKHYYEKGTLHDIIHPPLLNQILSPQSLLIYSKVAYSCLNDDRAHRPDMHHIMAKLEKALELQLRGENIVRLFFLFYYPFFWCTSFMHTNFPFESVFLYLILLKST